MSAEIQWFRVWIEGCESPSEFRAHAMSINGEARTLLLIDSNGRPIVAIPMERVRSAFRSDTLKEAAP